jgi:transposase
MARMTYANTIIFFHSRPIPHILSPVGNHVTIGETGMKRDEKADQPRTAGSRASTGSQTLLTYQVGALPILNRILARMKLEDFLREAIEEDPRCEVSPVKALSLLVRNFICSREPIYGVGEWAGRQAPDLLGLETSDIPHLNDDRVGRCLVSLFNSDFPALVLRVVGHVIREFQVSLDELHNDSTTITLHGGYEDATQETMTMGKVVPAITWGHNKDHRPDLKQILYTLTITADGAVPIYFSSKSGNVTDDQTHRETWDLLRQIVGDAGFLYVADCKLATTENMAHIASKSGRFISVLPDNRKECKEFREQVSKKAVTWEPIWEKKDENGEVEDTYSIVRQPAISAEGYRVIWFYSTRKAELDAVARNKRVQRALKGMSAINQKLLSPTCRRRQRASIQAAVEKCLARFQAKEWIRYSIRSNETETFHQARPGRPSATTPYRRKVTLRWGMEYEIDQAKLAEETVQDGIFPLISNDVNLSDLEILQAYKRQPLIEKRFSQLKTDFAVAPVYLKSAKRITALLCVYFFALLVQALVERELRRAMAKDGIESLPIYPEGRACAAPTTRRLVELFENVQRHELQGVEPGSQRFLTSLSSIQKQVVELLGLAGESYGG